jgi:bacteriocin-like protein
MAKKDKTTKAGATRLEEKELKKVSGGVYLKYKLTDARISQVQQDDDDASER